MEAIAQAHIPMTVAGSMEYIVFGHEQIIVRTNVLGVQVIIMLE